MNTERKSHIIVDGTKYETRLTAKFKLRKAYKAHDPKKLTAFIPGVIDEIFVRHGKHVRKGEPLLILEAMKMKNNVNAHDDVTIKAVHIKKGQRVAKDELLIEFE